MLRERATAPARREMSIDGDPSADEARIPEREAAGDADGALEWHDVRYAVGRRGTTRRREILRGTSGIAHPGRLHGILGPSGSGKTTLLNILAGRVRERRGAELNGDVMHDGELLHASTSSREGEKRGGIIRGVQSVLKRLPLVGDALFSRRSSKRAQKPRVPVSYVEQDPKFFSNLTVRETLTLDSKLHGGDERDVDDVLRRLGLNACADTLVGGDTGGVAVRGVSGGERRRLAIACETLGLRIGKRNVDVRCIREGENDRPLPSSDSSEVVREFSKSLSSSGGVVLADEPTTGLDAHQADKIVAKLKEMAVEEHAVVVAVLHQPRSRSFERLDDLTLLTSFGKVAYCGPVEDALAYFAKVGHVCPHHHNPAEFLIDLVAVDSDGSPEEEAADAKRVAKLVDAWESKRLASQTKRKNTSRDENTSVTNAETRENVRHTSSARRSRVGAARQFVLLVGRAWRQTRREAWVNAVRLVASAGLAAAFGGCNRDMGNGASSVKRRAAVLMQACINTSMLAVCRSLNGFPRERATVSREMHRSVGGYGAGPYFFSKLLVETPVDAVFPVVFGFVLNRMAGLNRNGRNWLLTTLALQTAAASTLGLSVGALSPSSEMALAIGPCVMVLSIMLGDETGAFAEIPASLTGVSHLSLIKWAFRGCLSSEFEGLKFDPLADAKRARAKGGAEKRTRGASGACPPTGEHVLSEMGLPTAGGARIAAKAQAKLVAANALLTYLVLKIKGA